MPKNLSHRDEKSDEPGVFNFGMPVEISVPDIRSSARDIIGVGVDIVACGRVERMLDSHGERFLARCFTPDERRFCISRKDSAACLASRLAAKEAGFKAIGGRRGMGLGWRDFEVVFDREKIPMLLLHGDAKTRGESLEVGRIWLSLTDEDEWSVAVVIMTS